MGGGDNCRRLNAPPKNLLQEFWSVTQVCAPAPPLPSPCRAAVVCWLESPGGIAGRQVISSPRYHASLTSLLFTCAGRPEVFLKTQELIS